MISIVWTYRVKPPAIPEFERRYSPDGDWAALFRRAPGYIETLLLRDAELPGSYLTVDRWETLEGFENFKRLFAAEYEKIDQICSGLTESEQRIGVFYSLGE